MSDMEITIKLPEELVERAQAVGIDLDSLTGDVAELLERRIELSETTRRIVLVNNSVKINHINVIDDSN